MQSHLQGGGYAISGSSWALLDWVYGETCLTLYQTQTLCTMLILSCVILVFCSSFFRGERGNAFSGRVWSSGARSYRGIFISIDRQFWANCNQYRSAKLTIKFGMYDIHVSIHLTFEGKLLFFCQLWESQQKPYKIIIFLTLQITANIVKCKVLTQFWAFVAQNAANLQYMSMPKLFSMTWRTIKLRTATSSLHTRDRYDTIYTMYKTF